MRNVQNVVTGWIDTSVGAFVRERAPAFAPFSHVLVTSIDSATAVGELPAVRCILAAEAAAKLLGEGLVLPRTMLAEAAMRYNLFTGFDELWCFGEEPMTPKPEGVSIVAPLNLATDPVPDGLVEWLGESGCALGLGDGIGMNFVARDERTSAHLLALSAGTGSSPP